jgi:hypothetical protein
MIGISGYFSNFFIRMVITPSRLASDIPYLVGMFPTQLKFKAFEIQACCDCSEGYDGNSAIDNWNSLGKFCGSDKPHDILSTQNKLSILFLTDNSINYKGFVAEYEVEDQSKNQILLYVF